MKIYRILGQEGRVTIPYELRQAVGLTPERLVSLEVIGDGAILIRREKLPEEEETKIPTMLEMLKFLNSLTESQQHDALVHLYVWWAEAQKKPGRDGR